MGQETLQGYADQINTETNRIGALLVSKEDALAAAATKEQIHSILGPVLAPLQALGKATDPVPVPDPDPVPPVDPARRR